MKEPGPCPQCGNASDDEVALAGSCPTCLLVLGLRHKSSSPESHIPTPSHIGPYEILDILGEDMAKTVYLAQQDAPVYRKVAITLISPEVDCQETVARYEAERQTLSALEHPNVLAVLEAGMTNNGWAYFVTEYAEGKAITTFCDENRRSIRERLKLFVQVCAAIHYVHERALIHRDIRPSNILVGMRGGVPEPKVIGFGIAKSLRQRLAERASLSKHGTLPGVLAYVSPEQTETTDHCLDLRTDVYSLGVLLYELLVGILPFDGLVLREDNWMVMDHMIREVDPPSPSTQISMLGDQSAELSQLRQMPLRAWRQQLKGELDRITMRAIEKKGACRYGSAAELGADVQSYLNNEPVGAMRWNTVYRFRKLVERFKEPFALMATSLVVLDGVAILMIALNP